MRSTQPDFFLCTIKELEDAIEDLCDDKVRYVVSLRMVGGLNVYSLPTTIERAKEKIGDLISAMENDEIIQLSQTVVNTKNICTARILKYTAEEKDDDQS